MGGGVVLFPCGAAGRRPHAFHRECLDDWLARYAEHMLWGIPRHPGF